LAYGIVEKVPRGLSASETLERIQKLGGIGVAAHPYRWYTGLSKRTILSSKFSAFEARNARSLTSTNNKIERLASRRGIGITGGSDSHDLTELGRAVTVSDENLESEDDLIEAILKRRTKVAGQGRPMSSSIRYARMCIGGWLTRGMKRI
ncbi:MAG: histidinol-phosphatase, partial [Thermoplasmata archaeon]|nr:histidinol-phosphatase [Thermoplasmata archaeon]